MKQGDGWIRRGAVRLRGYLRRFVLLFVILWLLIDVRVSLWRMPYAEVRARVDRLARRKVRARDADFEFRLRWVKRLGALIPRSTCLVRALALQILLARRGIAVDVVFGARINKQHKFDAHAWVEYRGRVLLGEVEDFEAYKVLRRESVKVRESRVKQAA